MPRLGFGFQWKTLSTPPLDTPEVVGVLKTWLFEGPKSSNWSLWVKEEVCTWFDDFTPDVLPNSCGLSHLARGFAQGFLSDSSSGAYLDEDKFPVTYQQWFVMVS